jgi:hypothetical protein
VSGQSGRCATLKRTSEAFRRRTSQVRLDRGPELVLPGQEAFVQIEAAGTQDALNHREARIDRPALPTSHLGAWPPEPLPHLALRQAGSQSSLADQLSSGHHHRLTRKKYV